MKALSIVALVFASLSIFIPVGGIFIALLCSVFALISFRSQPVLSGITFGINIINTAFLTPSLILADAAGSGAFDDLGAASAGAPTESGELYFFYVGFHVGAFAISIIWRLIRGKVEETS